MWYTNVVATERWKTESGRAMATVRASMRLMENNIKVKLWLNLDLRYLQLLFRLRAPSSRHALHQTPSSVTSLASCISGSVACRKWALMDTRRRVDLIISAFNEQDSFYLLLLAKYECSETCSQPLGWHVWADCGKVSIDTTQNPCLGFCAFVILRWLAFPSIFLIDHKKFRTLMLVPFEIVYIWTHNIHHSLSSLADHYWPYSLWTFHPVFSTDHRYLSKLTHI